MRESRTVIESWRNEGRHEGFAEGMAIGMLEARRADVLRAYQLRFQVSAAVGISAAVRSIDDLETLTRWLDAAITAPNPMMFEAMIAGHGR